MSRRLVASLSLLAFGLFLHAASAQTLPGVADRYFVSSDGVRLHYLEAGPPTAHTIIFVPGWTMPAWIWAPQIGAFEHSYHVVAFDPRGQGDSAVAATGYEPGRRGQDIAELIARMGQPSVLLVGWSLGVLDALAYVHADGDRMLAGLVLVDNSVGEAPAPPPTHRRPARPVPRPLYMERFVRTMFRTPQSPEWLDRLTEATLRTPDWAARELLAYPVPREVPAAGYLFDRKARALHWYVPASRRRRPTWNAIARTRRPRCSRMPATLCSSTTRRVSMR